MPSPLFLYGARMPIADDAQMRPRPGPPNDRLLTHRTAGALL